jgi:hypothetical protein
VEGCGRKHAAHGFCLMHYKRINKHGSPDYKWGGKVVGRKCAFCDRPAVAKEMCWRHYQMDRKHGNPLHADSKKIDGLPPGMSNRRGYVAVTSQINAEFSTVSGDPSVERTHRTHDNCVNQKVKARGNGRSERLLVHRIITEAKKGEIVHHINGDKTDNEIENLHVFPNQSGHTKCHKSLETVGYQLIKAGIIVFDPDQAVYKLDQFFCQSMLQQEQL